VRFSFLFLFLFFFFFFFFFFLFFLVSFKTMSSSEKGPATEPLADEDLPLVDVARLSAIMSAETARLVSSPSLKLLWLGVYAKNPNSPSLAWGLCRPS